MKIKNMLLLLAGVFLTLSSVNAEYKIYTTQSDFEKDKGAICEAATDGCNTYMMKDGKVFGGTRKMCKPDFKPEWNCTKFKENTITTLSMPIVTTSVKVENILSDNDQRYYDVIKDRLDDKYQNAVDKAVSKYEIRLSRFSDSKKSRMNELVISKIDTLISKFLMQYPQDIALPKKANDKYLTLTLLKFELMKLNY